MDKKEREQAIKRMKLSNIERNDKFTLGDDITSKVTLYYLLYPCKILTKLTRYVVGSPVPKQFLQMIKDENDAIIEKWTDIRTEGILKEQHRPYIFELVRYSKEELKSKGITDRCIDEFEKALDEFGFHFDTNLTEEDMKKIFSIRKYINKTEPNVKLSLEDDEICDYNRNKHIGR